MTDEFVADIELSEDGAQQEGVANDAPAQASAQGSSEFAAVKARLEEIAQLVSNEDAEIDSLLDLYEEAVNLGLKASDLLEVGITAEEETAAATEAAGTEGADGGSGAGADEGETAGAEIGADETVSDDEQDPEF